MHSNLYGEVDAYGSKKTTVAILLFLSMLNISTYAILKILNKYPHIFNFPVAVTEQNAFFLYKTATRMIRWINLFICLLFTGAIWEICDLGMDTILNKFPYNIFLWLFPTVCIILCAIISIVKMTKKIKNNEREKEI